MKHLLIIDDEKGSRESLHAIFGKDYDVTLTESAGEADAILKTRRVDGILLDVMMPDIDGLTFLRDIQNRYPNTPVVMVSANTDIQPVVQAMRDGAHDFVSKPFDVRAIRRTVERAVARSNLTRRVTILEGELSREFPVDKIVGESPPFLEALENARKAAQADSTVLICGESGTGKELVARLIHSASTRRDEPFVAVHCASLPESLMESELFGHEKGAFTNAERQKLGRFDLAGSGTLFFDEVSEMSLTTQVKLLRVLQEREFMRVGGTQVIRTNARIVAASAKTLSDEVEQGRFRDDLYYRVSVIPIRLPPLRERAEDIPLLARHFLKYFRGRIDVVTRDFEPEAMDRLCRYGWPGNIRELRNIVERTLVLHAREKTIRPEFFPEEFHHNGSGLARKQLQPVKLSEAIGTYERHLIQDALRRSNGVQTKAARLLGTTRRILKYRMEKLNIPASAGNGNGNH